ncbi:PilZ domain-containing protein [Ectothiorhodospiraceae bacterium BW-2]|nr:PilZ domain-containing protein [Ectothiorhodospiraceae bacterium BW-2]
MAEDDRRRSFRIDDNIYLRLTSLTKAEKERESQGQVEKELKNLREFCFQSNHMLAQIRKSNPDIAQYLAIIDKKINILTRIVSAEQFTQPMEPNHQVNISSTGLSLRMAKCSVKPGSQLSAYMLFFPSYLTIECVAEVVYCRPENKRFRMGIEFIDLDETAQEQLMRHLIERQSEQIRQQRNRDADNRYQDSD